MTPATYYAAQHELAYTQIRRAFKEMVVTGLLTRYLEKIKHEGEGYGEMDGAVKILTTDKHRSGNKLGSKMP